VTDILADFGDDADSDVAVYHDKDQVKIAGIITAKKTKITKNGTTMAFLRVDDKYSECEVIVFAKQYAEFASILAEDSAVLIEANISEDEENGAKLLLSSAKPLLSNAEYAKTGKAVKKPRLYIKLTDLSDPRLDKLYRCATLNPGDAEIVVYDAKNGRYSVLKGFSINPSETVIARLSSIFSPDSVIFK
jgi:DNA polymerase-3 subunit alpha